MSAGVLFWLLAVVGMGFLLLAIGLLMALINTAHLEREREREEARLAWEEARLAWEEARRGD